MEDFKSRIIDEATALMDKIVALESFIYRNEAFFDLPFKTRFALRVQLFYMRRYSFWLSKRISWCCTKEDIAETINPEPLAIVEEPVSEIPAEKKPKAKRRTKKKKTNE